MVDIFYCKRSSKYVILSFGQLARAGFGRRNVFEHSEERSFRNGPSSPFQRPCIPVYSRHKSMQFNIMHVRYSTHYSKPQGNQLQYVRKLVALDFLDKHFGNHIHIIHALLIRKSTVCQKVTVYKDQKSPS